MRPAAVASKITPPAPASRKKVQKKETPEPRPQETANKPGISFDRRTERKFRKGDVEIDGKLDLHGMTQIQAHSSLARFIERHAGGGSRMLLVITGKGKSGKSVLRSNLPRWCTEAPLSKLILALRPAAIKHGGDGAFYLTLRKKKEKT